MNQLKFKKSPAKGKMEKYLKDAHWRTEASIIAFRILGILEQKGMTQRDLAAKMGKSPQWINKIVKGQQNLTIGTLKELETALAIPLFQIPVFRENVMTMSLANDFTPKTGKIKQIGKTKIIKLEVNPQDEIDHIQKFKTQA